MAITINVTPAAGGTIDATAVDQAVTLSVTSGIGPVSPNAALIGGTGIDVTYANGEATLDVNATLATLTDVSAAAPSAGQVLEWNGTAWAPGTDTTLNLASATPSNLGTAAVGNGTAAAREDHVHAMPALGDLTDVTLASPSAGEVLTWNGTAWSAAADSTNLTGYATESYVDSAVANLVDSSPAALDTLNELAAALGDDANFAANVTASLAGKAAANHTHTSGDVTDFATAAAANAPLQTLNGLSGDINITGPGIGIGVQTVGQNIVISYTPPSTATPVQSLNTLTGDLTLAAGDNVTITTSGSTLTFSAAGGGGGVSSLDAGTFPRVGSLLTETGDTVTSEAGDQITPEQATSGAVLQVLRSNVTAAVPTSLADGELAINTQDGSLFWADASGTIQSFALAASSGNGTGGGGYGTTLLFG